MNITQLDITVSTEKSCFTKYLPLNNKEENKKFNWELYEVIFNLYFVYTIRQLNSTLQFVLFELKW